MVHFFTGGDRGRIITDMFCAFAERVLRLATDRYVEHGGRAVKHAHVDVAEETTTISTKKSLADIQTNAM